MRKCTRPSPLYRTKQRRKAGLGTGNEASIAQLKDTDHARSYDTKNILKHFTALNNEAVLQVGPGEVSISVVATEEDFLVLC